KHRQEIIFRAVRRLDDFLLLLDRRLRAIAFGNGGRDGHCSDCQRGGPCLQHQERLVLSLRSERSETIECSPNCDRGQNENTGGGFARCKTKCSPDDNWSAKKRNRIIPRRNLERTAEDNFSEDHQEQEQNTDFDGLGAVPFALSCRNAPEDQERRDYQVSRRIAEPPGQPNLPIVCPMCETAEGKGGY